MDHIFDKLKDFIYDDKEKQSLYYKRTVQISKGYIRSILMIDTYINENPTLVWNEINWDEDDTTVINWEYPYWFYSEKDHETGAVLARYCIDDKFRCFFENEVLVDFEPTHYKEFVWMEPPKIRKKI